MPRIVAYELLIWHLKQGLGNKRYCIYRPSRGQKCNCWWEPIAFPSEFCRLIEEIHWQQTCQEKAHTHKLDSISKAPVDHSKRVQCPQSLKICEFVCRLNPRAKREWMLQERRQIVDEWTLFPAPLISSFFLKDETPGQISGNCALPIWHVIGKIKVGQRKCLWVVVVLVAAVFSFKCLAPQIITRDTWHTLGALPYCLL